MFGVVVVLAVVASSGWSPAAGALVVGVRDRCGVDSVSGGGGGGPGSRDTAAVGSSVSNDSCFFRIPRRFVSGLEVAATTFCVFEVAVSGSSEVVLVGVVFRMPLIAAERPTAGPVGVVFVSPGSAASQTTTRMALNRAHTSAKAAYVAKFLLLNKRLVKKTGSIAGYDSTLTYNNYTVSRRKVPPPRTHCHNSNKQCQILTEFWTNNAMSNSKQIFKFK